MKIAGVEVGERPLVLAPMEDVTNPPFRKFCKAFGADWLYSEFVSADALVRSVNKSLKKLTIDDSERPVTIQIYGRFVDSMVEAARIVEEVQPDFIDLNFGCPVKRVAQKGAGAGLLRDVPLMVEMARQVVNAVKLPVTAKTRLGWDSEHIIIEDIAERLQDVGIRALAIHGRTRAQMYTGEADWEPIARVKSNPRITIPIIGNGDVTSPERAAEAFDKYGVDAVMIGRAAIGRPWPPHGSHVQGLAAFPGFAHPHAPGSQFGGVVASVRRDCSPLWRYAGDMTWQHGGWSLKASPDEC